jgi:4-aminobutyrate aminotransferase-like enzyme
MAEPIRFDNEPTSNALRAEIAQAEPIALRTQTPTLAVLASAAGIYHWTPEGRRLADFSSGVLVSNLGHNPRQWLNRLVHYLGWHDVALAGDGFAKLPPLTSYNAITPLESEANRRLLASLRTAHGGGRLEQVLWAASGSEGIQKALWAALHYQCNKDIILATRGGFHGKKGLAGAVTGDENSPERDPRVKFISFPKRECYDVVRRSEPFDPAPYAAELEQLRREYPGRLNCLITEPYLGGGGSFHPPPAYLQLLQRFCREHNLVFILDEVQSNFGRTGNLYAYETYGIEPDIVVLGKGMGNGVPVNAAVGRADVFASLTYGEGSDTWSANPLACAAVLATLDVFEATDVIGHARKLSVAIERWLCRLKELPIVAAVRGEGVVWGIEMADAAGKSSKEIASECVRAAYLGDEQGNAIHLLGPLSGNVLRISPPLTMTLEEAEHWFGVLFRIFETVCRRLRA